MQNQTPKNESSTKAFSPLLPPLPPVSSRPSRPRLRISAFCFLLSAFGVTGCSVLSYTSPQIPAPATGEIERWLIPAATVLSVVALWKKVFPPRRNDETFATKAELNQELSAVRDKIDARFLTLTEKIETVGASLHTRLNQLEAGLARVDERTRKNPVP